MKAFFRRLVRPLLELQVKRLIARRHLQVVAVAGAVGKTSTKLAIAAVLQQKYHVLVHPGNYNAEIGLPLAIFELEVPRLIINPFAWCWRLIQMERRIRGHYPYNLLVLELGTDHPGEIPHFLTYLRPAVGVVTAVAPEHMENFADLDAVAAEELSLAAGSAAVLVNHDEVATGYRRRYLAGHSRHYTYGQSREADFSFELTAADPAQGSQVTLYAGDQVVTHQLQLHLYGHSSLKTAVAAYAVGQLLDLTPHQLGRGLETIRPVPGRLNPLPGQNGSLILDDSYNSSPQAAAAGLQALAAIDRRRYPGRRLAILGSMNELGPDAPRYHQELGRLAAGQVDLLITVGQLAHQYLGPAALAAGFDPQHYSAADSPVAAGAFLRLILQPGDVVLVKGSQNQVFTEEATKLLLADPADVAQLVRQSPAWLKVKARQFPDLKLPS